MTGTHSTNQLVSPKRILIVDDHELVRIGLRALIDKQPDLEVCGEIANHAEARSAVGELLPDLLIVDLTLESGDGLHLMRWIRDHHPDVKIVVNTAHDERTCGLRALRAGASAFINKQEPAEKILVAIRRVLQGELYFSKELSDHVLWLVGVHPRPSSTEFPTDTLSDRELQVFRLLGDGNTTEQIAKLLHLSVHTVGTYRERLKHKLDVHSQAELMRLAVEWVLKHS